MDNLESSDGRVGMIMKFLLSFLLLFAVSAFGAVPSYNAFRGTGGISIVSNPPTGTIVIDGSGVVATGTNSSIRASTNGTTVTAGATNLAYWAGTNLVVTGTNVGSTAHINYRLANDVTIPGNLSVRGQAEFSDEATFNGAVVITNGATAGHVLTSDAVGVATWQAPTGGSGTTLTNGNLLFVDAVYGNNTTALRGRRDKPFLTPVAAKAAATNGDTIVVFPGQYNNATNLLKNGVNWFGYNSLLTYTNLTNDAGVGIFDDRFSGFPTGMVSGAVTSVISGFSIRHSCGINITNAASTSYGIGPTNILGMFVITNPLSFVQFAFDRIEFDNFTAGNEAAALSIFHGRGFANGNEIVDPYLSDLRTIGEEDGVGPITLGSQSIGTWWKAGDWHVNVKRCTGRKYTVYPSADTTNTSGNFWYTGDLIVGKLYGNTVTYSHNWKSWIHVKEIQNTSDVAAVSFISGGAGGIGKLYLTVDKIGSSLGASLDMDDGWEIWLNAQKMSGQTKWLDIAGGTMHANVMHFEDLGTVNQGFHLRGGALDLKGNEAVVTNVTGSAVFIEDGTASISGIRLSTLNSTNSPVVVRTNGLVLANCTLLAKSTAFSVLSHSFTNLTVTNLSGNTVNLQGCWANKPETNTISYLVGPWTVDSNVR